MYERMLDKHTEPSFPEMLSYCGGAGSLWAKVDEYFQEKYPVKGTIRFPYGNKYGWSMKYSLKSKHICDIFAEAEAFFVLIRLPDDAVRPIYSELGDYAKEVWDARYPCGSGGWLNYRVTGEGQLADLLKIIDLKVSTR